MIKNADVTIFDEPTNALDAGSIAAFLAYLQEIKQNRIIIVISNYGSLIAAANRLITLKKRRFAAGFSDFFTIFAYSRRVFALNQPGWHYNFRKSQFRCSRRVTQEQRGSTTYV